MAKEETVGDLLARLEKEAEDKSLGGSWKPTKAGEKVSGEVTAVGKTKNKKGKAQQTWTLKGVKGEVVIYESAVLKGEVERIGGLAVGDLAAFCYKGTKKSQTKGHQPMKLYSVVKVSGAVVK